MESSSWLRYLDYKAQLLDKLTNSPWSDSVCGKWKLPVDFLDFY